MQSLFKFNKKNISFEMSSVELFQNFFKISPLTDKGLKSHDLLVISILLFIFICITTEENNVPYNFCVQTFRPVRHARLTDTLYKVNQSVTLLWWSNTFPYNYSIK